MKAGFQITFLLAALTLSVYSGEVIAEQKSETPKPPAKAQVSVSAEKQAAFAKDRPQIIEKLQSLMTEQKYQEALTYGEGYRKINDPDIVSLLAQASDKLKEQERKEKETKLLASLSELGEDDLKGKAKIYVQLTKLDPQNVEYKMEHSLHTLLGYVWIYSDEKDAISQKTINQAAIFSSNAIEFRPPYEEKQRARLFLRKHPRYGNDVILTIKRGQFQCRYDDCSITVRFGDGKARKFSAGEPSDRSSDMLFIKDYNGFLSQLRKVDKIYIEAAFFQEGNHVFEFETGGLEWK